MANFQQLIEQTTSMYQHNMTNNNFYNFIW